MKTTMQTYQGEKDLQAILDLVKRRPAERILDYPALADLQEMLMQPEIQAATRVWETEDGRCAGYALINHGETYADLAFELAPEFAAGELGDEMIAWGEQAYCASYHGETNELTSSARAVQPERIHLLEKHGYIPDPDSVLHFERRLADPIPEAVLPPGFSLRPVVDEEEDADWVELHRAGFGTQNMTLEYRRSMTSHADYERGLDLVAVAPDGRLAAYVFGTYNREEMALCGQKIGFTDPVATHPDFQGMGLARALLAEALRRFKERGFEKARLGTSSENIAMQKAAQAVGFCIVDQAYHYAKHLRG